jgi:hypothetical protein
LEAEVAEPKEFDIELDVNDLEHLERYGRRGVGPAGGSDADLAQSSDGSDSDRDNDDIDRASQNPAKPMPPVALPPIDPPRLQLEWRFKKGLTYLIDSTWPPPKRAEDGGWAYGRDHFNYYRFEGNDAGSIGININNNNNNIVNSDTGGTSTTINMDSTVALNSNYDSTANRTISNSTSSSTVRSGANGAHITVVQSTQSPVDTKSKMRRLRIINGSTTSTQRSFPEIRRVGSESANGSNATHRNDTNANATNSAHAARVQLGQSDSSYTVLEVARVFNSGMKNITEPAYVEQHKGEVGNNDRRWAAIEAASENEGDCMVVYVCF